MAEVFLAWTIANAALALTGWAILRLPTRDTGPRSTDAV